MRQPFISVGQPTVAPTLGAFNPSRADLSRILHRTAPPRGNVCVSDVLQRTYVEGNEQGTVAAAATGAIVRPTGIAVHPPPIEFVVDRPFWIVIRDDRTGLILSMGHIVDPPST